MKRNLLFMAMLALPLAVTAEEVIRQGDIYATVDIAANGDVKVLDIHTDLPADVHPTIASWLEGQTIVLPDTETDAEHRVLEVRYEVIEDDDRTQSLAMGITDTNATLPEAVSQGVPVDVRVHLGADGEVVSVEPLSELPAGVTAADIEAAVAENIESDPAIIEAAADDRLSETTQTMTVIIRQRED